MTGVQTCALPICFPDRFQLELQLHRQSVHSIFSDLFAGKTRVEEGIAANIHRFVNHNMNDAQVREWLTAMGFEDAPKSLHILCLLRDAPAFGHSPSKMRNLLANVLTSVMENAAKLVRPDAVITGLERLIESVGSREAFFTSLLGNPRSISRIVRVLALSDYLSDILFSTPEVLDFLIDDDRLERPIRRPVQTSDRKIQEFYAGVQHLLGIVPRRRSTRLLTRFAEREVRKHIAANGPVAIFALGKFGERELNFRSDLDIVAVYQGAHTPALDAVEHLIAELSPHFKLDLRLRPDGKKGSLIFNLERYREYLADRAETWERMAFTRARFIAGNPALAAATQSLIDEFVYGRPFGENQAEEMKRIRYRMEFEIGREKEDAFDVKVGHGGFVDIEFLSQIEQMRRNIRIPNTVAVLKRLNNSAALIEYYEFLREVEMMLRLWSSVASTRFQTPDREALGIMVGVKDFAGEFNRVRNEVRKVWQRYELPLSDRAPTTRTRRPESKPDS